ncbi:hypothetical protein JVU11DRAFT_6188 [Chiua virens]|nr:hypothetical protein JVU11DRAFT_6188 [Chiua virens]
MAKSPSDSQVHRSAAANAGEMQFQELFDLFIIHASSPSLPATAGDSRHLQPEQLQPQEASILPLSQDSQPGHVTIDHPNPTFINLRPPSPPPSPPPSLPPSNHVDVQLGISPSSTILIDQEACNQLADRLGFPALPSNWKKVLYYAYNHLFSATVLHVPRVHRNTLVHQAVILAKQQCEESSPFWTPEENEMVSFDGGRVRTSMAVDRFRTKLHSTVMLAEKTFHNHTLQSTIYLLTSGPNHSGLMPHLPGPPGTLFNSMQRGIVAWYLTWDHMQGYKMWHNDYDQLEWFENAHVWALLHSALRDTRSPGYFDLKESYRRDGGSGIWAWRPLQAQGDTALSIVSYVLASTAVSLRSDFLQESQWDQEVACPSRRSAVERDQSRIYNFFTDILSSSLELSPEESQRARTGLVKLLEFVGYTL